MRRPFAIPAAFVNLLCVTGAVPSAYAATITYVLKADQVGASIAQTYGTDGYDLYATSTNGEPTSGGGVPFGPTRLSHLPSYITAVTADGANSYFRSNLYAPIVNPANNAWVHAGLTYNFSPSSAEKNLLNVAIGSGAPSSFYIGYITDINTGVFDYPDGLRMRQTAGTGAGDSGMIATLQDAKGGLDAYFFRVINAHAGDVITISGFETVGGANYKNLTCVGLTFGTAIPEPATAMLGLLGLAGLLKRKSR